MAAHNWVKSNLGHGEMICIFCHTTMMEASVLGIINECEAPRPARKPILCVDFDGVLNSYVSGWQGAAVVSDPPVKGAIEFLRLAVQHFRVAIYSSRSGQPGGISAMQSWLWMWAMRDDSQRELPHWFKEIEWPIEKPPALVTLDDRALTFTGEWPEMGTLLEFKPWNKK